MGGPGWAARTARTIWRGNDGEVGLSWTALVPQSLHAFAPPLLPDAMIAARHVTTGNDVG